MTRSAEGSGPDPILMWWRGTGTCAVCGWPNDHESPQAHPRSRGRGFELGRCRASPTQLFTRLVDQQGQTVLNSVRAADSPQPSGRPA
jgi:hypothetical protein